MPKEQDIEILNEVGRRLRQTREVRGLNLHELARLCGISAPALSLIETGKRDPRLTTIARIAKALRLSLPELLSDRADSKERGPVSDEEGYDLGDYQ